MTYTPSRALDELIAQHDALRSMMDRCERLAKEVDAGHTPATQLAREVARLRVAFEAHNRFEEALLKPVLEASDLHATARIGRMVEDHVHEHAEIRARLETMDTAVIVDVIETLRAHLEAEERYLLTSRVLRDPHVRA